MTGKLCSKKRLHCICPVSILLYKASLGTIFHVLRNTSKYSSRRICYLYFAFCWHYFLFADGKCNSPTQKRLADRGFRSGKSHFEICLFSRSRILLINFLFIGGNLMTCLLYISYEKDLTANGLSEQKSVFIYIFVNGFHHRVAFLCQTSILFLRYSACT